MLTEPGLSVVVEAIIIARIIFQRINSFINYRVAATMQLLVFFFIAVMSMEVGYGSIAFELTKLIKRVLITAVGR